MDYINYVKQSPVQGLTGLYGGVQGSLMAAAAGGGGTLGDYYGGRGMVSTGSEMEYFNLATTNNAQNFGEMADPAHKADSCAAGSGARVYWAGGNSYTTDIEYYTTTSLGSGTEYADLINGRYAPAACSNGIRGMIAGGSGPAWGSDTSNMEYITIWTGGNASNFGERTVNRHGLDAVSGGTRGIFANGQDPHTSVIDYVTISTTSNASNFGNTTDPRTFGGGTNSDPGSGQERGIFCGGYSDHGGQADYIDCASTGNASDWGGLEENYSYRFGTGTGGTKGFCAGGTGGGQHISYMTIESNGSSSAGGDLISGSDCMACTGTAP